MSALPKTVPSADEYLEQERKAEFKSEYIAGEILAMAGASLNHNRIVTNLGGEIRDRLKDKPCEVLSSDMKVRIDAKDLFVYPDLSGLGGEFDFYDDQEDVYRNPKFIIEVLSKSTESYDRGKNFEYYQTLTSLDEYVLVSQYERRIEIYRKQGNDWLYHAYSENDESIHLESVNCEIPVSEIYRNVDFDNAEA